MKKITRFALFVILLLAIIACNIPGSDNDRREQEYNYKIEQAVQEQSATENAQNQSGVNATAPSVDNTEESQNASIATEVPAETTATTPLMVFEGTGTVVDFPWGVEDVEHSCTSEAKVTLTITEGLCKTVFVYPSMAQGVDKVCRPYAENTTLVTGPYSSTDGSCTFNSVEYEIGASVDGAGVLMGAAKVEFWIQTSVEDWVKHYYSDYLSPQS